MFKKLIAAFFCRMGSSSSKRHPLIVTRCSVPPYCLKMAGTRHLIIGGGGGASRTGVKNEIQVQFFLLPITQKILLETHFRFLKQVIDNKKNLVFKDVFAII